MFYGKIFATFINVVIPVQAIGLYIFPMTSVISRSMNFNHNLSTEPKIALFIQNIPYKVIYTELEIYELQQSIFNQFERGQDVQDVSWWYGL